MTFSDKFSTQPIILCTLWANLFTFCKGARLRFVYILRSHFVCLDAMSSWLQKNSPLYLSSLWRVSTGGGAWPKQLDQITFLTRSWPCFDSGFFDPTNEIFFDHKAKKWKIWDFGGKFSRPRQQKKLPNTDQKSLAQIHH